MLELLTQPWPWYIAGPVIGLTVPAMLFLGSKAFGFSSNFRHICAACIPGTVDFFNYDWKKDGGWNMMFLVGTILGGFIGGYLLANPEPIQLSAATIAGLQADMNITNFEGIVPVEIFSWEFLGSGIGLAVMISGGFLVGFGTRYAGGCTSGHAISGLSNLQVASLIAVVGFFIGGLLMTHIIMPAIFG